MAPQTRSMSKRLHTVKGSRVTKGHTQTISAGATTTTTTTPPSLPPLPEQTFPLLQLPQEIADMVYADALQSDTAILRTSHQVHAQAARLLPQHGVFRIVIEQSWRSSVCYIRPLTSRPPTEDPFGTNIDPQHIEIRIRSKNEPILVCGTGLRMAWNVQRGMSNPNVGRRRPTRLRVSPAIPPVPPMPPMRSMRWTDEPGNPMLKGLISTFTGSTETKRASCRVVLETKLDRVSDARWYNFLGLVASLKAFESVEVVFGTRVEPVPTMKVVERDICPTLGPVDRSMGRRCWRFSPPQ